jgi:hypothetical protein
MTNHDRAVLLFLMLILDRAGLGRWICAAFGGPRQEEAFVRGQSAGSYFVDKHGILGMYCICETNANHLPRLRYVGTHLLQTTGIAVAENEGGMSEHELSPAAEETARVIAMNLNSLSIP